MYITALLFQNAILHVYQGVMVGFKDELLFSHNKKELTKDLPYFDKVKVSYMTV